jgi:hypothetical protein
MWPAKRVLGALDLQDYEAVFSCSQPTVCHLLGRKIQQETSLPWVAYFSDPWIGRRMTEQLSARIIEYNRQLERDVVRGADRVVFSSLETKHAILEKYGAEAIRKADVLNHCFFPEWFYLRKVNDRVDGKAIRVLFTGSFYHSRTPIPFLEILAELNRGKTYDGKIVFDFYGSISESDRLHPIWTTVETLARFRGAVDYPTSLALMKAADYLFLIDAPVQGDQESVFFPSKLAEYLGADRPIIGLTPRNGATSRILQETGHHVVSWSDKEAMKAILDMMLTKQLKSRSTSEAMSQFDFRCVGKQLFEILQSATRGSVNRSS